MCQTQNYIKILGQTCEPNSSPVNINTLAAKLLAILGQPSLILVGKRPSFQIDFFSLKVTLALQKIVVS